MLKKKGINASNTNVMYKELNNRITMNALTVFSLLAIIGWWIDKTDKRLKKIESDISQDRVKLYHDIEEDYGFMMTDNEEAAILLENAK